MVYVTRERYLTGQQVGWVLGVSPKTVARWAKEGKIRHTKTLGGHRRYLSQDIDELKASLQSTT